AVRELRDDVLAVLRAAARGEPRPAAAVRRINEHLVRRPVVRLLRPEADGVELRVAADGPPLSELLATVAAAVVELLAGPDAGRLALCDAPGCGQLYLRDRRNQRWCGDACGTRARVVRHQRRVGGRST
ncbi:ABATE domain-containing protein, partial [Jiangella rhizosphaerae]